MSKERIHVLVVEDEDAHAELIRRAFEPQSDVVRLSVAKNLQEARVSLTESLPDLAIVDLFLPDGRGLELLEKNNDQGPDYPVVIVTSHGDEEAAVDAMKAGALQYVVKSEVALAELPHKVETALRQWGHIVERKQAESALQASEEHFRSLIENALDIITVVDERGKICYNSPSFENLLGNPAAKLLGEDFFDLVHPEDRQKVEQMVAWAFREPPTEKVAYRHRHSDDSWRHLEAVGSSYQHSTDGRLAVVNARDVTDQQRVEHERRKLEDRLRHARNWEVVADLAGDIAREFNETLNPILDYATMTLQETPQGSKTRAGLERVLAAAHRSRRLAERIFVVSRQGAPSTESLRLQELVSDELLGFKAKLPENVEMRSSLETDCRPVLADPGQMHEILANVFSNALYAMRESGGVLDVRLESAGELVRLSVGDTGQGMDAATLQRALEAFFTTKTSDEPAGLGLSITHAIVASHGGELKVTSEAGKGTTIRIDLPAA